MLAQPCLSLTGQKPGIQFTVCSTCMLSVDIVFFCYDMEFLNQLTLFVLLSSWQVSPDLRETGGMGGDNMTAVLVTRL